MLKQFRTAFVWAVFGGGLILPAVHGASAQVTMLSRQLSRLDVGVSGMGVINNDTSGSNYLDQPVGYSASTTVGALVQARYTKSPLLGAEFTYSYARYTNTYTNGSGAASAFPSPFGVQANASNYTLGYVAHLPSIFGLQPFASVGGGATAFKPTPGGGEALLEQARATYYYTIGVDDQITPLFGIRAQFRQTFLKAPDFGANYLTINEQTITSEPSIGAYIRF